MHYDFKTQPYDHQRKAFLDSWATDYFALLMEMGSGKSKVADLDDVNDQVLVDGGTLVYEASSNNYVLKNPDIDGGTF